MARRYQWNSPNFKHILGITPELYDLVFDTEYHVEVMGFNAYTKVEYLLRQQNTISYEINNTEIEVCSILYDNELRIYIKLAGDYESLDDIYEHLYPIRVKSARNI